MTTGQLLELFHFRTTNDSLLVWPRRFDLREAALRVVIKARSHSLADDRQQDFDRKIWDKKMGLQNADPGFIFLSKMFLSRLVAAERSEAALGFPWFLMSDAG